MSGNIGIEILKRKLRALNKQYGPEAATVCTLTLKVVLAEPGIAERGVTLEKLAQSMDMDPSMLGKVVKLMCDVAFLQRVDGVYKVPDWLFDIGEGYNRTLNEIIAKRVGVDLDNESLIFSSEITMVANLIYARIQAQPEYVAASVEEKLASITALLLGDITDLSKQTMDMLRKVIFNQPDYYRLSNLEKLAVYWVFFGPNGPKYEKELPGTAAAFLTVEPQELEPLLDDARRYLEARGLVRYVVELDRDEIRRLKGD